MQRGYKQGPYNKEHIQSLFLEENILVLKLGEKEWSKIKNIPEFDGFWIPKIPTFTNITIDLIKDKASDLKSFWDYKKKQFNENKNYKDFKKREKKEKTSIYEDYTVNWKAFFVAFFIFSIIALIYFFITKNTVSAFIAGFMLGADYDKYPLLFLISFIFRIFFVVWVRKIYTAKNRKTPSGMSFLTFFVPILSLFIASLYCTFKKPIQKKWYKYITNILSIVILVSALIGGSVFIYKNWEDKQDLKHISTPILSFKTKEINPFNSTLNDKNNNIKQEDSFESIFEEFKDLEPSPFVENIPNGYKKYGNKAFSFLYPSKLFITEEKVFHPFEDRNTINIEYFTDEELVYEASTKHLGEERIKEDKILYSEILHQMKKGVITDKVLQFDSLSSNSTKGSIFAESKKFGNYQGIVFNKALSQTSGSIDIIFKEVIIFLPEKNIRIVFPFNIGNFHAYIKNKKEGMHYPYTNGVYNYDEMIEFDNEIFSFLESNASIKTKELKIIEESSNIIDKIIDSISFECSVQKCLFKGKCIQKPENGFCIDETLTDAWKCEGGYSEIKNRCIKTL